MNASRSGLITRIRKSRKRLALYALPLLVVGGVAAGLLGTGRGEAVTCTLAAANRVLITSSAESEITISRDAHNSLGDSLIRVNGAPCGTLSTIDAIDVQGSSGSERLTIDQSNGRFIKPATFAEIRFGGNLGAGADADILRILGNASEEDYTFGKQASGNLGGTLNNDTAAEISLGSVEQIIAETRAGSDRVSAGGTNPAGLNLSPADQALTVDGGAGDDTFVGGNGTDTATYASATMPVLADLAGGSVNGEQSGNDSVSGIENVIGGSSNDTFVDDPDVCNEFTGGRGDDRFVAKNRPTDEDCGGHGDTFHGDEDTDTYDAFDVPANSPGVIFDFPNSIVRGSPTGDVCTDCENGEGTDAGEDVFIDDPDVCNVFNGNGDNDTFVAKNRPGTEEGGTCGDSIDGGEGRDTYDATDVPANSPGVTFDFPGGIVHGSGEDDCANCENGMGTEAGDDVFIDDTASCNVFEGQGGDDTFVAKNRPGTEEGGTCGDTFDGGEGGETAGDTYDAFDVPANSPGVTFDFPGGIVHGSGSDGCLNCENGNGSEAGGDTFIDQDNSCNTFNGNGGDDLFQAGVQRPGKEADPEHGNRADSVPGDGLCGDIVDLGETGEVEGDTLNYAATEANSPGVKIDLPRGITSGSPEEITANAENATGTEHADEIIGNEENNVLKGLGGDDVIYGGPGDDHIEGGPGNDTIDGGPGNDTIDGGEGDNTITDEDAMLYCNLETGLVVLNGVETTGNTSCPAGTANDDTFIGNSTANTFYGNGGNDTMHGNGGNDVMYGGAGDDQIHGGDGGDVIYGEAGNDTLNGNEENDELYGGDGDDQLSGGAGNDKGYGGNGNDTINGDDGNDDLRGGAGNDTLNGGAGNDVLRGEGGNDTLDGGADNDVNDGGPQTDTCTNGETTRACENGGPAAQSATTRRRR